MNVCELHVCSLCTARRALHGCVAQVAPVSHVALSPSDVHNKKAVFAIDLEKVGNQALYSGYSTKDGSIVTIDYANTGMGAAGDFALVYMIFDGIVSIRDGSVDVFE